MQVWIQDYNPLGITWLTMRLAALPVTLLFYLIGSTEDGLHRPAVRAFVYGGAPGWIPNGPKFW